MQSPARFLIVLLTLSAIIFGCNDEMEEHYARPDWLEAPIYQQLQSKGNFKSFLACVDKAGYKSSLSGAGYFTVFAPNDAAFTTFLTEQGLSGVEAIDTATARRIVTYALVYNAFDKSRLDDYQSNLGWQADNAFKRRTAYYEGVYDATTFAGEALKATSSNRNGLTYVFGDNNNKHIPYFLDSYFDARSLSASDYNYFYPDAVYTGFNVADASVVTEDIYAENGIIHEIDKVILPLANLEAHIASNDNYSVFKELLEKYAVQYTTNADVTARYRVMTGSNEPVYVKFYTSFLGFSPNNENYLKQADNDAQSEGWTLFAPTNDAANQYINDVLLEHYTSLDQMPPTIIYDFVNAHMWQASVWPTKFDNTLNFLGEEARFDPAADIVEAKVLSNGMFYGTSKAQDADVFRSVYGKAYLNPKYSLMTLFFNRELKSTIISPHTRFTLFLVPDDVLIAAGHNYNAVRNEWTFNGSTSLAVENWSRMVSMHVMITQNGELDDLSGSGIAETYGGEFIKWDNNTVFATGNLEENVMVTVNTPERPVETAHNGTVYFTDKIIMFPDNNPVKGPGFYIRDLGDAVGKPYQRFFDYLKNSAIYNSTTGAINGVSAGVFHTFFIPSNTAIAQAVTDGVLPASITPTTDTDKQKVIDFISYHMLPRFSIINNGKEEGTFETLYKTLTGDATVITIVNDAGVQFTITDLKGRTSNVVNGSASNVLGNRAVYHQIDNYLRY
jgi:uncharacterized surface protein with fasciclin (FAS1) repeats